MRLEEALKELSKLNEAPDNMGFETDDEIEAQERAEFEKRLAQRKADRDTAKKKELDRQEQERQKELARQEAEKKGKETLEKVKDLPFDDWFDYLVPSSGKADTVAGEIYRAIAKIDYRFFNDGDVFYDGYGRETCGSSVEYLIETVNDSLINDFYDIAENKLDNGEYEDAIEKIKDNLKEYLLDNPELFGTPNEDDSRDSKKFDLDIEIPEPKDYEYTIYLGDYYTEDSYGDDVYLKDYIDNEIIDVWEVQDELKDILRYENIDFHMDRPFTHYDTEINLSDLTKDGYDRVKELADDEHLFDDYISDLIEKHGLPNEQEVDESLKEEKSKKRFVAFVPSQNGYIMGDELTTIKDYASVFDENDSKAMSAYKFLLKALGLKNNEIKREYNGIRPSIDEPENKGHDPREVDESLKENKQDTYVWKKDGDDHILTTKGSNKELITLSRMNKNFPYTVYVKGKENKKLQDKLPSDNLKEIKDYILKNIDSILGKKVDGNLKEAKKTNSTPTEQIASIIKRKLKDSKYLVFEEKSKMYDDRIELRYHFNKELINQARDSMKNIIEEMLVDIVVADDGDIYDREYSINIYSTLDMYSSDWCDSLIIDSVDEQVIVDYLEDNLGDDILLDNAQNNDTWEESLKENKNTNYKVGDEFDSQDDSFVVVSAIDGDNVTYKTIGDEEFTVTKDEFNDIISTMRKSVNGKNPYYDYSLDNPNYIFNEGKDKVVLILDNDLSTANATTPQGCAYRWNGKEPLEKFAKRCYEGKWKDGELIRDFENENHDEFKIDKKNNILQLVDYADDLDEDDKVSNFKFDYFISSQELNKSKPANIKTKEGKDNLSEAYIVADKEVLDIIRADKEYGKNSHVNGYIPDFSNIPNGTKIVFENINHWHPECKEIFIKKDENKWEAIYDWGNDKQSTIITNHQLVNKVEDLDTGCYESLIDAQENLKESTTNNNDIHLDTELCDILDVNSYNTVIGELDIKDEELADEAKDTLAELISQVDGFSLVNVGKINHPKYYNYYGDTLDFTVKYNGELGDLIEKYSNDPKFIDFIKDRYKSYSGFVSFMADNRDDFIEQSPTKSVAQILRYEIGDPYDTGVQERFNDELWDNYPEYYDYEDEEIDESLDDDLDTDLKSQNKTTNNTKKKCVKATKLGCNK